MHRTKPTFYKNHTIIDSLHVDFKIVMMNSHNEVKSTSYFFVKLCISDCADKQKRVEINREGVLCISLTTNYYIWRH